MDTLIKFAGHASSAIVPGFPGWFDNVDGLEWTESMTDPRSGLGLTFAKSQDAFSRVLARKVRDGTPFRHVKVRYATDQGPSVVHLEDVLVTAVTSGFHDGGHTESVTLDAANWWVE